MRLVAAILDWAGTTVDYGSLAPIRVLQKVFEQHGVPISAEEGRAYMGLLKRDHIERTLSSARVQSAWTERYGEAPGDATVTALYAEFIPLQMEILADYSTLIPGVGDAVERMRARGMKIGTSTGYTRPMLELLIEKAAAQGYRPDCSQCPDDVGAGRPHPWMCYQNAIQMKVYPLWATVKIGDTTSDIDEGRNAGMWTVGVAKTGNLIGLSEQDWGRLPPGEQDARLTQARDKMLAAGAHYVIDSVANIDETLDRIEASLARGERP
jgi:phosphonoacetaldehyde hydrolase